jgi:hypothetical protein
MFDDDDALPLPPQQFRLIRAASSGSGYKSDLFLDEKTASDYHCVICYGVCREIVQLAPCGHLYCSPCANTVSNAAKNTPECPICRATFNRSNDIDACPVLAARVSQMLCVCPYSEKMSFGATDCPWIGMLRDVDYHVLKECPYAYVVCKYCQNSMERRALRAHVSTECKRTQAEPCEGCLKASTKAELDLHEKSDCQLAVETCEGCSQKFKRLDLKEHHKSALECVSKVSGYLSCEFASQGCKFRGNFTELGNHMYQDREAMQLHLDILLRDISRLETEVQNAKIDLPPVVAPVAPPPPPAPPVRGGAAPPPPQSPQDEEELGFNLFD